MGLGIPRSIGSPHDPWSWPPIWCGSAHEEPWAWWPAIEDIETDPDTY